MKKHLFLLSTMALLSMSCEQDSPTDVMVAPTNNNTNNKNTPTKTTYNGHVKSIIDNNCVICHGANGAAAGLSLTNFNQVKTAVQTRGLLTRINSNSNPMPQSGKMPQSNIDVITKWNTDGLLETE